MNNCLEFSRFNKDWNWNKPVDKNQESTEEIHFISKLPSLLELLVDTLP